MEKFTEILNQCTGFLEGLRGNDQFVQLFGSVVRYLLPVLVFFVLLRCAISLLTFRKEPEIWAWLVLPGGQELMRRYLSPAALEQFPQWVQAARGEENDLGENSPEPADRTLWAQVDREDLCRSLRQACLDAG